MPGGNSSKPKLNYSKIISSMKSIKNRQINVSFDPEKKNWTVHQTSKKANNLFHTKAEAIQYCKQHLKKGLNNLVVHDKSGRITFSIRYGVDTEGHIVG